MTEPSVQTRHCPDCGAVIAPDAPLGQCPSCLLGLALGGATDGEPDAALLTPGQARHFGDYELREEVAHGGMGVVYRAWQTSLGREVALKMILAGDFASPATLRLFQTEARAAANLHHPHIVPVYETGEHELQHYFTMRFVPGGRTIADWAREHRERPRDLAAAMALVARAVAHAHERGVLHRDLKPSNILWDPDTGPQVTDFGLAKLLDYADAALSGSALLIGSPCYMAPEQAEGRHEDITTATDVHGLGTVLYELLSGHPPFQAGSVTATARLVVEQPPPRLPTVPRDLETICLKCLEKDPGRRYHSALDLAEDLERFVRGESILARPMTLPELLWSWARRNPALAAMGTATCIALLLGVSGITWQWRRAEQAKTTLRATVDRLEWHRIVRLVEDGQDARGLAELARLLRSDPGHPQAASFSLSVLEQRHHAAPLAPMLDHGPGSSVIDAQFSSDGGTLRTLDQAGRVLLWDGWSGAPLGQDAASLRPPALLCGDPPSSGRLTAPDGLRVAEWSPQRVRIIPSRTDAQDGIECEQSRGFSLFAWSADGAILAGGSTAGARLWDAASGHVLSPLLSHLYGCTGLAFSPDNQTLFTSGTDGLIRRWRSRDGSLVPAASLVHPSPVMGLALSPQGDRLVATLLPWNARSTRRGGAALLWDLRPRPPEVLRLEPGPSSDASRRETFAACAWSGDGTLCAIATVGGRLALHRTGVAAPLWEASLPGYPRALAFLPDARLGVVTTAGEISLWSASDGTRMSGPWKTHPIESAWFHPEGRLLATGGLGGQVEVWDLATGSVLSRAATHEAPLNGVSLSPDGGLLASVGEDGRLIVSDTATGRALFTPVRAEDEILSARFSPDSRRLVTASHDRTATVFDARTGVRLTPPLRHEGELVLAVFDASGRRILTAGRDGVARLWDATSGQPLGETMRHRTALRSAGFCPDGRRVLTEDHDGLRLWDAATGEPLTLPLPHPTGIGIGYDAQGLRAAFSPDGRRILHATATRDALIWSFPEAPLPAPDWLPDLLEAVGRISLDALGSPVSVPPERWLRLRERLRQMTGEGFYEVWGRRFAR